MRESCISCVVKHLSQAIILTQEAEMGYPNHKYLAIGHMAEASDEAIEEYPQLARDIREVRKVYESTNNSNLLDVWKQAIKLLEEWHEKALSTTSVSNGSGLQSNSGG